MPRFLKPGWGKVLPGFWVQPIVLPEHDFLGGGEK